MGWTGFGERADRPGIEAIGLGQLAGGDTFSTTEDVWAVVFTVMRQADRNGEEPA